VTYAQILVLTLGALAVLCSLAVAAYYVLTAEGTHHAPRSARRVPPQRARAGAARAWRRVLGVARRLPGAITLPNRGDAQGRDVRARASTTRRAARAHVTGSLSPRSPMAGPRACERAAARATTWAREAIARRIQALPWWVREFFAREWPEQDPEPAPEVHHGKLPPPPQAEAVLDYPPRPSFWDSLSADTLARGFQAVR